MHSRSDMDSDVHIATDVHEPRLRHILAAVCVHECGAFVADDCFLRQLLMAHATIFRYRQKGCVLDSEHHHDISDWNRAPSMDGTDTHYV